MSFEAGSQRTRAFYTFLIAQTAIAGLFVVFLPVYLWQRGADVITLSGFIAATAVGFLIALPVWLRLRHRVNWRTLARVSLALAVVLPAGVHLLNPLQYFFVIGVLTGFYNCFFWMLQRTLFIEQLKPGGSGNAFGNLQITVAITLKISLLAGAFLLHYGGTHLTFLACLVLAVCCGMLLQRYDPGLFSLYRDQRAETSVLRFAAYAPHAGAWPMFFIDGFLLFAESHFWMVSLYSISGNDFRALGLLVVALGVSFSIIFYLCKRLIDTLTGYRMLYIATTLYTVSWLLRAAAPDWQGIWLGVSLISITFATALFRLSFNKMFFDRAREEPGIDYITGKSVVSQSGVLVLALTGCVVFGTTSETSHVAFKPLYFAAATMSLVYLFYRPIKRHVD